MLSTQSVDPQSSSPTTDESVPAESPLAEQEVLVIRPPQGWQLVNVAELWRFRELIYFLAWKDVKVRYKQTALGAAWAVLQPAMMMVVFTIFFGRIAGLSSGDIPYPLFVYAGLLPWTFFSGVVTNAGQSVVGAERLITKVYFPRLALPFSTVGSGLVDFTIAFGLLVVLMLFYPGYHFQPTWSLLLVPLLLLLIMLGAVGAGTLIAGLHVAYRDFRYVTPFLVQLWMFATPAIYVSSEQASLKGDSWYRYLLALNPLTPLIGTFRQAFLGGPIAWGPLALSAVGVVLLFVAGCLYFRKVESWFADII